MSCSFYYFRQSDYYCSKKQDYVNEDTYRRYCRDYSYDECPIYKVETSSGGCYLTTACVVAKGLPDDCMELTTLRNFRDNWLQHQPGGPEEIAEYYAIAPKIIEKINQLPVAQAIWLTLYEDLVLACVHLIKTNHPDTARALYKTVTNKLMKEIKNESIS